MWRSTLKATREGWQREQDSAAEKIVELAGRARRAESALVAGHETNAQLRAEVRAAGDYLVAEGAAQRALRDLLLKAEARIAELDAAAKPNDLVKREASKLTDAIRDQARGPDGRIDPRLVAHFRGEANKLLRQNKDVDDVIEQLSTWQTTETTDQPTVERIVASFNDTAL